MSAHTRSQPSAQPDAEKDVVTSEKPPPLGNLLTGLTLPALLILLTFVCATGFYIVETPRHDNLVAEARSAGNKWAVSSRTVLDDSSDISATEHQSFEFQPVTLTLYSRIKKSLGHAHHSQQLTLFPKADQFYSLFPDTDRTKTFIDVSRAYSEQTVDQMQIEVPVTSTAQNKLTQGTAMMLEYVGVGFPNVGVWLNDYDSLDAVAASFRKRGISEMLLPRQYFRPLLVGTLANVSCNGNNAAVVNRRADRYRKRVQTLAESFEVDPNLILAVAAQESCFYRNASSPAGAQGLMQLMPKTASLLGVRDAYDAGENLKGGVRYLAMLQKEFATPQLVLAAYNAGPGSVKRYDGIPPFAETQHYVRNVLAFYRSFEAAETR